MMKNFGYILWIAVLSLFSIEGMAQQKLNLDNAIEISLDFNYGIRLVKQDLATAENNNQIGNAGMLPRLNISGTQNFSTTNSQQEFLSGQINDRKGAQSDALNAGVQLNWTIFDGLSMFRRLDQLALREDRSELELLLEVENTISNIYSAYYGLVQLSHQQQVVEKTLALGHERYLLAANKLETGAGSKLSLLQSQVDLNADSALYLNLQDQSLQLKTILNQLMGRNPATDFFIEDTIRIEGSLDYQVLHQQMLERNTSLALARTDEQLALLALREIKGKQLPELGVNLGYNFTNQQSESGFLLQNRSSGVTYGLSASMNLFNGFNTRRETQNIQISIERNRIKTEALENELTATLLQYHNSYLSKLQLLEMERQNLVIATENLDIAAERFKLGDLSGLEFRDAQRSFLDAELRFNKLSLEIKLLETALLQLSGNLQSKII